MVFLTTWWGCTLARFAVKLVIYELSKYLNFNGFAGYVITKTKP
jgi:hypothetical protein